ncbi:hypothetical protein HMPREF1870_02453 [Bacteroidales bacterium KA00344]|nr:hypothetical protein HMPREF1870_02453 [Bacteroidales bacterium KA00344]
MPQLRLRRSIIVFEVYFPDCFYAMRAVFEDENIALFALDAPKKITEKR